VAPGLALKRRGRIGKVLSKPWQVCLGSEILGSIDFASKKAKSIVASATQGCLGTAA
jgi:hypothetical protein